jgi:hypothetical protein
MGTSCETNQKHHLITSIKIASKKNREAYINYVLKIDACCQKKILGLSKINN